MKSMVDLAHAFIRPVLHTQAIGIDATLGRGHDARFLLAHRAAKVYAFEIQEDIARMTAEKLKDSRLEIFVESHDQMETRLKDLQEQVDAIFFNFGYCPGCTSGRETQPASSLAAVKQALGLLRIKGRMALVFYPHENWQQELNQITAYLKTLDPHVIAIQKIEQFNACQAPLLFCLEKKKSL